MNYGAVLPPSVMVIFFNALFQLVEFCVGPYNTVKNKEGKNEAILIGTFCAFFQTRVLR